MKSLSTLSFLCLLFGCFSAKYPGAERKALNGTWIPIRQEIGGKELPKAYFEKQKLILQDSLYTLIAESMDKGITRISPGKLDIYGKEGVNEGKHFTSIYKLEKDELTVCYNLAGDHYPESFSTQGHPLYFLSVFKKAIE
jgi:uncharacterized protein (TIGR03067 family)